jgi:hypothetical protein
MNINKIYIQDIKEFYCNTLTISILRADLIDPVVSGNKWFKLQFYVRDAIAVGKTTLATSLVQLAKSLQGVSRQAIAPASIIARAATPRAV